MRDYISFIEDDLNIPVRMASVGPQRHETILK
ncbi:MAG: adenylosuccinate synthetase [FCB group bacterium]|nr:adenylosuccinate synthetase [FCB group bacterium]